MRTSILVNCDNGDATAGHEENVRECPSCVGAFCQSCRETFAGNKDRCPLCNSYMGSNDSCRLIGGCGR